MTLNQHDECLIKALRLGKHLKVNPGDARKLLQDTFPNIEESDILASYRRVTGEQFARSVQHSSNPGGLFLRLTDAGMARADQLLDADRKPTWPERLRSLPIGKGVWDIFKIGLGFLLGLLTHKITGS